MHKPYYSFIIPVYNRPQEIEELLESISQLSYHKPFEVVIVEDGSSHTSEAVCKKYYDRIQISYFYKENTGPGASRNYGMQRAKGDYFLILDSDVILPNNYLEKVDKQLTASYVDCFGGVDTAHASFSELQKAIDVVMTSFWTTGGIRGGGEQLGKFQPRSFNMGISKTAFEATNGFGKIHPGEDPDLSLRLWDLGFKTALFKDVKVFHKRRISWRKFWVQVNKFGKCRPILTAWHPSSKKVTYWFPTLFSIVFISSTIAYFSGNALGLVCFLIYFLIIFLEAFFKYESFKIGGMSILATLIQMFGYGYGFFISTFQVRVLKRNPKKVFPSLFFN